MEWIVQNDTAPEKKITFFDYCFAALNRWQHTLKKTTLEMAKVVEKMKKKTMSTIMGKFSS